MKPSFLTVLALLTVLSGCADEKVHDAQGRWNGTLFNQGTTIELGVLTIGQDYIAIPYLDERYAQLVFDSRANETYFSRKSSANFQGEASQQQGKVSRGSIKFTTPDEGLMSFNRIQGTIRLTR